MSHELLITDADLERLTELPSSARDARIAERAAELVARGVTITVSREALAVLARNDNRYTWSGDVRGG